MNKNLKKVISVVAALALSVTSFVAMASYPDTVGNKHESAINELSALGVIDGFEDGTFHPDELVTRAQMAKLVVSALNIANAESNKVAKFNDVAADNWAAGWIATAADNGIINGTGNGNFDPNANVTYAQTAKMLVAAMGYETWAENQGGWPSGYLYYANGTGVTNNISGVSNDTALTRAQCAQMIANALEAPMLKQTSMSQDYQGNPVAIMSQMDGTNDDKYPYTSLLTDKWDIYVVNGTVMSDKTSDNEKVTYAIEKSKNYQGSHYGVTLNGDKGGTTTDTLNVGDSNAAKYAFEYTKALVYANDYDESEIVYIESAGKNEKVDFATSLFSKFENNTLKVKKSASTSSTTTYKLAVDETKAAAWTFVVNGVVVDANAAAVAAYIENNKGAVVTLIDNPSNGVATDGYYDVITVDYYVTAVVDSVVDDEESTVVYFKAASENAASIEVIKDDEDYSYSFVKDGVAVEASSLVENNVLSIAYNPLLALDESKFYDVVVSDKTTEGKVTQSGTNAEGDTYYAIGDAEYVVASNNLGINVKTGGEYTAYLTADGKIAFVDKLASSINYAVLDRLYRSASGEINVRIIGKDGQKHEYELYDEDSAPAEIKALIGLGAQNANIRIIDYTLTSANKIKIKDGADMIVDNQTTEAKTYTASTQRLGSTKIDDSTVVIDLSGWVADPTTSPALVSVASFVDGAEYKFVTAKDSTTTAAESVPFMVVTEGLGGFTVDTQMAIVKRVAATSDNSADRTQLTVLMNGEETTVLCEDTTSKYSGLQEGDAIIFKKDSDGYIDELYTILNLDDATTDDVVEKLPNADRYDLFKAIQGNTAIATGLPTITFDGDPVVYKFNVVVDKTASSITLGKLMYGQAKGNKTGEGYTTSGKNAWYMNAAGDKTYSYDADVKVYTFDGEKTKGYRVNIGAPAAVAKTFAASASAKSTSYLDAAGMYINLGMTGETKSANTVAFALLRTHDDIVKEVYSISMPKADKDATFQAGTVNDVTATPTPTPTPEVTPEPTPEVTPEPTPEVTPEP